ncbi:MAG: NADH-quinone oxidoreductase subunit NuoN [Pseudohongiellaceae bacterium]
MLTLEHLVALTPLILIGAAAVTVMLGIAWRRHHAATALTTGMGVILALLAMVLVTGMGDVETPLLVVDGPGRFSTALILASTLVITLLAYPYLEGHEGAREEFYLLLLCAVGGAMTLVSARHLATLFLGVELLSMPLYGMVAYRFRESVSLEAGIKYLVLSAAATAFLLFGMALLYARTGELELAALATALAGNRDAWVLAGAALMIIGLGFKLSLVPFHLWTPDVYQGSPAPTAVFLATVSKLAVFVVLLRLVMAAPLFHGDWLQPVLAALALLSMLAGNLLALFQNNLKRLLGFSSIAHFGYLLVALVVASELATETTGVYLLTYIVTTLAVFGVVTVLASPCSGEDSADLADYRGLFWRRPWLAGVLTLGLLSLAGIPPTAGFIGKFYVIALTVEAGSWWLAGGIVLGSAIGLYYYLRVLVALYLPGEESRGAEHGVRERSSHGGVAALIVLAALIILLGVYPSPMIEWAGSL